MTAIQATTVSAKTMADGSLRLTVEVEPKDSVSAFTLFGSPGNACALARLHNRAVIDSEYAGNTDTPTDSQKPRGGPLARLAGLWSSDRNFWKWIELTPGSENECREAAAGFIRRVCGINSRAELDNDERAAQQFHEQIRRPFSSWLETINDR